MRSGLLAASLWSLGCCAHGPPPTPSSAIPTVGGSGRIGGVVFEDDRELEDADVRLSCDCLPAPLAVRTGDDGKFLFRGLPPGVYAVHVVHPWGDIIKVFWLPRGAYTRTTYRLRHGMPPQQISVMSMRKLHLD